MNRDWYRRLSEEEKLKNKDSIQKVGTGIFLRKTNKN